jgi:hypothetical protein
MSPGDVRGPADLGLDRRSSGQLHLTRHPDAESRAEDALDLDVLADRQFATCVQDRGEAADSGTCRRPVHFPIREDAHLPHIGVPVCRPGEDRAVQELQLGVGGRVYQWNRGGHRALDARAEIDDCRNIFRSE